MIQSEVMGWGSVDRSLC